MNETYSVNGNAKGVGNQAIKPQVARVCVGGEIRLIGVSAAARWLGCSPQALGQVARGKQNFANEKLSVRAKQAFPELFGE